MLRGYRSKQRREAAQNGERPSGFTVDRTSCHFCCMQANSDSDRPCCMLSNKTKRHNDYNADSRNGWSVTWAECLLRQSLSANLLPWQKKPPPTWVSQSNSNTSCNNPNSHSSHMTDPPKHLQLVRYSSRSSWTHWGFVARGWRARLCVHSHPQTTINLNPVIK